MPSKILGSALRRGSVFGDENSGQTAQQRKGWLRDVGQGTYDTSMLRRRNDPAPRHRNECRDTRAEDVRPNLSIRMHQSWIFSDETWRSVVGM